jgi:hypothetical protein
MANISDILNRPAEDVEAPKPLPPGSYNCIIKGLPEQGESSKKKTAFLRFTFQISSARDDVDSEALDEYLTAKDGSKGSIAGRLVTSDYYLTDNALFMLTDMLAAIGIDFEGGKSISTAIDETPNMECVVFINHEPSADGKRFFARVGKVVGASEMDEAA